MSMREAFHIDEDDLIQYALGSLKETQLGTMTAHISLCNQCRDALAQIQVDLAAFGAAQPLSDVPAGAKDRFLAKLASEAAGESKLVQMRNKSRLYVVSKSFKHWMETPIPMMVLSGALAAALVFVAYDDLGHLHQLRQTGPAMARLEREAAELEELKGFLKGSNVQQVSLHEKPPLAKSPEGHTLYSAASAKLVFTASNIPVAPSGKAYELWILPAGKGAPIPAGVFKPDVQGNAAVIFPDIPSNVQASGFAVTIEREEGSPTPTMPIVLSGQ
jgi:anti-sigma-K factor RskA